MGMNGLWEQDFDDDDGQDDGVCFNGDFFTFTHPVVIWSDSPDRLPVLMPTQLWSVKNIIKSPQTDGGRGL
jgi:hypothetical protein